ncbi:MAG: hypothetical protein EOP42_22130 [Sphingobacteriaceae bacterium]|nr:MAG: hypothetical protein EOP42_22130 [Sphingobacteriaceae bacterium]
MLKYLLCGFCFLLLHGNLRAQEKPIQGIIFDQATKERVAKVLVSNARTKANTFNNLKGEFTMAVRLNDLLIFSKTGYFTDTIKVVSLQTLPVYLKRSSILLREVTIKDSTLSAQKKLLREIIDRDYKAQIVDARFNRIAVGLVTGLKGNLLSSFMYRYRPDYNMVVLLNDYDFIAYIKSCYNRFQRNPTTYYPPPLQPDK